MIFVEKPYKKRSISPFIFFLSLLAMTLSGCDYWSASARADRAARNVQKQFEKAKNTLVKNESQGIILLENLANAHPSRVDIWDTLASAYYNKMRYAEAAKAFENAALSDVAYVEHHLQAAKAYLKCDEKNSAVQHYRMYLEKFPEEAAVWYQVAELENAQLRKFEALDAYIKAVKCSVTPPNADVCVDIAALFRHFGNTNQEVFWYKRALEMDPKHPRAFLGTLAFALKDKHWNEVEFFIAKATEITTPSLELECLLDAAKIQIHQNKTLQLVATAQEEKVNVFKQMRLEVAANVEAEPTADEIKIVDNIPLASAPIMCAK